MIRRVLLLLLWLGLVGLVGGRGSHSRAQNSTPATNLILFTRNEGEVHTLEVMPAFGGSPTTLLSGPLGVFAPTWSPDGQRIAVQVGGIFDDDNHFYVVNADGSNGTRLSLPTFGFKPRWSPEGNELVFEMFGSNTQGNRREIAIMNTDGSNLRQLTRNEIEDLAPSFSPDGRFIAWFVNELPPPASRDGDDPMALYLMNRDGSAPRRLYAPYWGDYEAVTWSPDGSQLAFSNNWITYFEDNNDGAEGIFIVDIASGTVRNVTNDPKANSPVWSPDGSRLAYLTILGEQRALMVVDVAGGEPGLLFATDGFLSPPTWSPNGLQLAFAVNFGAGAQGLYTLYVDGSGLTPLTDFRVAAPQWQPVAGETAIVTVPATPTEIAARPSEVPTETPTPSLPPSFTPEPTQTAPDSVQAAVNATLTALAPTIPPSPTTDPIQEAVNATLTALAPSATPEPPTATATPTTDPIQEAVNATLTAIAATAQSILPPTLTPSPPPTFTPVPTLVASSGDTGTTGLLTARLVHPLGRIVVRYPAGWRTYVSAEGPAGEFGLDSGGQSYPPQRGDVSLYGGFYTPAQWPTALQDLRANEQAMEGFNLSTTITDTMFADGARGFIARHENSDLDTLVLVRQLNTGAVLFINATLAHGDLATQEALITDIFLSMQVSDTGEFTTLFSTDLPPGQSPALLIPEGGDACGISSGLLITGVQVGEIEGLGAPRPATYFGGLASADALTAEWYAVPGTAILMQLVNPPATVGPLHLGLVLPGYEWVDYVDMAVAASPTAPLSYVFDDRPAEFGYVVWVDNGWTSDPTARLFLTVRCVDAATVVSNPTLPPTPTRTLTPNPAAAAVGAVPTQPAPTVTIPTCTVRAIGSPNKRSGPGVEFATVGQMSNRQQATAEAYDYDRTGYPWWRLADGSWVRVDVVDEIGPCATLWDAATVDRVRAQGGGSVGPVPTATPFTTTGGAGTCTVTANRLVNKRTGPSSYYNAVGQLSSGGQASAVGQATGSDGLVWYQLTDQSWVRSDLMTAAGACGTLPIITSINGFPVNRAIVPGNARLATGGIGMTNGAAQTNGNFQVEGFCNRRGYDIRSDNNNWYCTSGGRDVFALSIEDFDAICQITYNSARAFATQTGSGSQPAYRWRCYVLN